MEKIPPRMVDIKSQAVLVNPIYITDEQFFDISKKIDLKELNGCRSYFDNEEEISRISKDIISEGKMFILKLLNICVCNRDGVCL